MAAYVTVADGSGWLYIVPTSRDVGYTDVTIFDDWVIVEFQQRVLRHLEE